MIEHSRHVEQSKEAGKDLADAQDEIKNDVQQAIGKCILKIVLKNINVGVIYPNAVVC